MVLRLKGCAQAIMAGTLLASALIPAYAPAEGDQEIRSKKGELQQIRRQIKDLQSELGSQEQQRKGLQEELRQVEQQIGKLTRRLRVLAGSLTRQQNRLNELQQVRQTQQQELNAQRDALAQQMRAAYAMGRQERLKILLNQQDPAVISRVLVYYDYFSRARTERIASISQALESIRQTELEISAEERRLQELRSRELAEKLKLEENGTRRRAVVAALNSQIKSKGLELTGLKKNEQQLQNLVNKLQDAMVALPLDRGKAKPFKQQRGRLRWPTKGRLAARFGTSKAGSLKWDGVIISAPEGREVMAIHHGRIAFADWLRGFGLMIIIDHGDGYMSLYGHNQSLFKEIGEWVEPGEAIALVGNSGGQLNSGVYFGLRHNGKPVNPRKWCKASKGSRVGMQSLDSLDKVVLATSVAAQEDKI